MSEFSRPSTRLGGSIKSGDIVRLKAGVYHIGAPIKLSGLNDVSIVGEGATLVGSAQADVNWRAQGDIYSAPDGVKIGSRRFIMARYPHYNEDILPYGGYVGDALEFAARCDQPTGAYLHAMHSHMWGDMHFRITGRDEGGKLLLEGGWQNNSQMGTHKEYRFVENLREALGADCEFLLRRRR